MPAWLHNLLVEEDHANVKNAPALMPVLAKMIDQDTDIEKAYLCHESVRHIGKIKGEGNNFCGYRNIQMLFSFLQKSALNQSNKFRGEIPSILELQDMIEVAWDKGFNDHGRVQTGGIKNTRKHIGTPEVSTCC